MIKITKVTKDYYQCNSCEVDNHTKQLYTISIGYDNGFLSSFTVCEDCIKLIKVDKL